MTRNTAPSLWLPGFAPDIATHSPLETELEFQSFPPALAVPDDIDLTESAGNAADEESTEFNPASTVPPSWRVGAGIVAINALMLKRTKLAGIRSPHPSSGAASPVAQGASA